MLVVIRSNVSRVIAPATRTVESVTRIVARFVHGTISPITPPSAASITPSFTRFASIVIVRPAPRAEIVPWFTTVRYVPSAWRTPTFPSPVPVRTVTFGPTVNVESVSTADATAAPVLTFRPPGASNTTSPLPPSTCATGVVPSGPTW